MNMEKKFELPKPVAVGDSFDVLIESQGGQGDGIAKRDGFIIFVKGATKGEQCKVRIVDVKRTFAIGEKIGAASTPKQNSEANSEMEQEIDEEVEGTKSGPAG